MWVRLLVIFILSFLNIVTASSAALSGGLMLAEHLFIIILLINKNYFRAFLSFLFFSTISLEMALVVFEEGQGEYFTFFRVPLFRSYIMILEVGWMFLALLPHLRSLLKESSGKQLSKWLIILLVVGFLFGLTTAISNDNNVWNSGNYPKVTILQTLSFFNRFAFIQICIIFIFCLNKGKQIGEFCQILLIGLSFASILSSLLGFNSFYMDSVIMTAPISTIYVPCLLLLYDKEKNKLLNFLTILAAVALVAYSFVIPTPGGSKWYIFILFSFLCFIAKLFKLNVGIMGVAAIIIIPVIANYASLMFGLDSYIGYKLNHAMGVINVSGAGSLDDWYGNMGVSSALRFDEVHNIVIEYVNKPFYSLFGKGFGGTTLHYTDLLPWETKSGAFSDQQIKMGAYYSMHESVAQILLEFGLIGIIFLFLFLFKLLKTVTITPWGVMGFLFLFFFLYYGQSMLIGAVAMVLALYEYEVIGNRPTKKNKHRRENKAKIGNA